MLPALRPAPDQRELGRLLTGSLALETNDPSLKAALVGEERAGLRFALLVRAGRSASSLSGLGLGAASRVLYWLGLAALFLVLGLIPYLLRRRRGWRLWLAVFATVDAAVLVTAMLQPNPLDPSGWPIQMGFRFHNVLYLFVLLAGAALSFSPILVIWTGWSAATAWSVGALTIAGRPGDHPRLPGADRRSRA